jgi:hypothetical protein
MFDIDMSQRTNCGAGDLKLIAAILQRLRMRPRVRKLIASNGG